MILYALWFQKSKKEQETPLKDRSLLSQREVPIQWKRTYRIQTEVVSSFPLIMTNLFFRFTYLANAQDKLDKETFRENMGLLGLDTGSFLADRIFSVLDADKDGHVSIENLKTQL